MKGREIEGRIAEVAGVFELVIQSVEGSWWVRIGVVGPQEIRTLICASADRNLSLGNSLFLAVCSFWELVAFALES